MTAVQERRVREVAAGPVPMRPLVRFELAKLTATWRFRVVVLVCALVPALVVAVVSRQSALPSDTVFGRWMHASGWAGSLVVLGFACSWALPLLVSLVAGDVFAVEDRLGTWRHLLVACRSQQRIFAAKALAGLGVVVALVVVLAASSVVGGLLGAGDHALVGLDGHTLSPGHAAATVLLAWLVVLAPTLAFAAVGLLGSVTLGRSPVALVAPALLALALALVQLLPLPLAVRMALPSQGFTAWRGLFTDPAQTGPVLLGVGVSLLWAVAALLLAHRLFLRRDFTDLTGARTARGALVAGVLPLALLLGATGAVLATTVPGGTGIDRAKLEASLATSFAHLYRLQASELHRPAVSEAQLRASATCQKGDARGEDLGPGNDWRCAVTWHVPGVAAQAVGTAVYQLDVAADGRYVADGDGPKEVNGSFWVRTSYGDAPNPLWQVDGDVDLLATHSKG